MEQDFHERLDALAAHMMAGEVDLILGYFNKPVTIFFDNEPMQLPDADAIAAMTAGFLQQLHAIGLSALRAEVTDFTATASGFRADAAWYAQFSEQQWVQVLKGEYYCRTVGDGFLIDMANFHDLAVADLQQWAANAAQSIGEKVEHG